MTERILIWYWQLWRTGVTQIEKIFWQYIQLIFAATTDSDYYNYSYDYGCNADEFMCMNGNCIYASWECDNYDDCGDNSDEEHCGRKFELTLKMKIIDCFKKDFFN